jgi:hypothetical protein
MWEIVIFLSITTPEIQMVFFVFWISTRNPDVDGHIRSPEPNATLRSKALVETYLISLFLLPSSTHDKPGYAGVWQNTEPC